MNNRLLYWILAFGFSLAIWTQSQRELPLISTYTQSKVEENAQKSVAPLVTQNKIVAEEKAKTPSKKRIIKWIIVTVCTAIILAVYFILKNLEHRSIFPGAHPPYHEEEENGLEGMKTFQSRRGYSLHYLCGQKGKDSANSKPQVVFFPGSDLLKLNKPSFEELQEKLNIPPSNLAMITYPGYGKNGRSWLGNDQELYDLADDFIKQLIKVEGYKKENIVIIGYSLGGALACYLGAQEQYKKVITISTFTSVRDRAKAISPFLSRFMSYHLNNHYWMSKMKSPWVGIHGKNDQTIPPKSVKELYENLPSDIKNKSAYDGSINSDHELIFSHISAKLLE